MLGQLTQAIYQALANYTGSRTFPSGQRAVVRDAAYGRSGRPLVRRSVWPVVLRLAAENKSWGECRIHGGLAGVPAIAGAGDLGGGLFTAGLRNGAKIYVLAAAEVGTRRAGVLGATGHPVRARAPRTNSIMERWVGSRRRELPDRALICNQRPLGIVLREDADFCHIHRPHPTSARPRRCARSPAVLPTWISSASSGVTAQRA